jgi:hypothetical protein
MARTLQAAPAESDLIYLCDSEAALNKISRWIGSGSRTTLAGDAYADIMISIIERVRERVQKGARTFMIKVKAHRGEPLNELADTQAENARQLQDECRQWTVRTPSMTYEWSDSNGVKQTTAWSKAVRKAMVRGGAEYQVQEAMNHVVINWSKTFLRDTNAGHRPSGKYGRSRRTDEQRALGERVHAPAAGRRKLEQTDNHDLGGRVLAKGGRKQRILGLMDQVW